MAPLEEPSSKEEHRMKASRAIRESLAKKGIRAEVVRGGFLVAGEFVPASQARDRAHFDDRRAIRKANRGDWP
jgi:hypothetical protein